MTRCSKLFYSYSSYVGNKKIKIVDGSLSTITGKGSIVIAKSLILYNVLHVPNLFCNMSFTSKLTHDLKCCIIGNAKESDGLYYFENGNNLCGQVDRTWITSLESFSESRRNEIMLCHFRLGHINFQYLKYLFQNLFKNKNPFCFQCDMYQITKHHHASFPIQPYKSFKPFTLVFGDV